MDRSKFETAVRAILDAPTIPEARDIACTFLDSVTTGDEYIDSQSAAHIDYALVLRNAFAVERYAESIDREIGDALARGEAI